MVANTLSRVHERVVCLNSSQELSGRGKKTSVLTLGNAGMEGGVGIGIGIGVGVGTAGEAITGEAITGGVNTVAYGFSLDIGFGVLTGVTGGEGVVCVGSALSVSVLIIFNASRD